MFLGHERHQVEGGVVRELGGGPALFGHNLVQVDKVEVFVFLFASTSNNKGPVTDSILLSSGGGSQRRVEGSISEQQKQMLFNKRTIKVCSSCS